MLSDSPIAAGDVGFRSRLFPEVYTPQKDTNLTEKIPNGIFFRFLVIF